VIRAAYEAPYERHPPPSRTTESVLVEAVLGAVREAAVPLKLIDGLGVASFTLRPDHAVDLAWRLGLRVRWLMEDTNGGASGTNLIAHARRALESGDASAIVLVAGDRIERTELEWLAEHYNQVTETYLAALPTDGPPASFAILTQRHMARHELTREHYGALVIAQRAWAQRNPGAVYRAPMSLEGYLQGPLVAWPLGRYDCVPPVTGADAIVLTADARPHAPAVEVCAVRNSFNADDQLADGLATGLREVADDIYAEAGFGPSSVDVFYAYDDYPAVALILLEEAGALGGRELRGFLRDLSEPRGCPVNTSGGLLSAGQAGAGAGLHHIVEAVLQLQGRARGRQVTRARRAAVMSYGMVVHRYGAAAGMIVLQGPGP
jgi:acetyl-CoA acetyltransferase